ARARRAAPLHARHRLRPGAAGLVGRPAAAALARGVRGAPPPAVPRPDGAGAGGRCRGSLPPQRPPLESGGPPARGPRAAALPPRALHSTGRWHERKRRQRARDPGGLPPRQRHVDVVLIWPAADGEEHAARPPQVDHLPPELSDRAERRAAEAEEPVPTLHADARRRAAGPHAAHEQAVLGARGRDAEELPGELVGARGGEGGGGQADLLVAAVAPE